MPACLHKAIIPAAGLGTRFLPVTKAVPKELLPVGSLPAIHYVIAEAKSCGIDTIVIVTAENKQPLQEYLTPATKLQQLLQRSGKGELLAPSEQLLEGMQMRFTLQSEARGLGHAVLLGGNLLDREPYAVLLPDDLLMDNGENLKAMLELFKETEKSVVALEKVAKQDVAAYGIAAANLISSNNREYYEIHDLVEKPAVDQAPSDLAVVGRYLLTHESIAILKTLRPGKNQEIQLTDALKVLAKQGKLVGHHLTGKRLDVGTPKGLLAANLFMAKENGELNRELLVELQQ